MSSVDESPAEYPFPPREHGAPTDEQELIRRVRLGDTAAFEILFRTYFRVLYHLIYDVVRSRAVAEEILQDLFASLWERRPALDVRGSLKSYLYRAARNRALSRVRRERLERRWQADAVREIPLSASSPPVETSVSREEFGAALARAVDRLPRRARQAYILRWQHHLPYAEIAQMMGISVKAVEHRVSQALKALRTALRDFGP